MHRFLVLYPAPLSEAARKHYVDVHVPLAEALPGIRRAGYAFDPVARQSEVQYALVFEGDFDDRAALEAALGSPEGAKAAADLANFAESGVVLLDYPVS